MTDSVPGLSAARLLTPEEIALKAGEAIAFLRLPNDAAFAAREVRLRQLGPGHAMADYLLFVADLARAQHEALRDTAPALGLALPTAGQIDAAARAGLPLLDALSWPRDARWRDLLRDVLRRAVQHVAATPAADVARRLLDADDALLDGQADRLLTGRTLGLDPAAAPFIAAGLQVGFTHLVMATQAAHDADALGTRTVPFGRIDDATRCPCCGSRPTASVTRVGADETGYRYLHCALCGTQWHYVRIKCAHCQGTKGIHYQSLQALAERGDTQPTVAAPGAVQAECCDGCGHYLKIVHMEKDLHVEPVADDLASLTLDLLLADTGPMRHGTNLMLVLGDPDEPAADTDLAMPNVGADLH